MTDAIVRSRRKARAAITAFKALIATPHNLASGPLTMPAGARLALSHTAALTLGQVTITIVTGRRSFSHPALAAAEIFKGDWAERGTRVSQTGAPTGTLSIYMVNPLDGTTKVIATQVVA